MDITCLDLTFTPKLYLLLDLIMQSRFISLIAPLIIDTGSPTIWIGVCKKRLRYFFVFFFTQGSLYIFIIKISYYCLYV